MTEEGIKNIDDAVFCFKMISLLFFSVHGLLEIFLFDSQNIVRPMKTRSA